ncbi:MAG TPA: GNAT family N-acetyltransferase [Devosia sp.]|jgi:GNAT superfamily N-acetyltransferase|uniref:GNAT family N-acetyltransferase n=1 Tax=Devosia sp. TaxID=1871048 RepID=UPI002F921AB7
MVNLRRYRESDLEALYHICLATGDAGKDASPQHADPKLVGHIYSAPYGVLEPEHVWVAEDDEGVAGYLVGTHDTDAFAARQERSWWPTLRTQYDEVPEQDLTAADLMRLKAIRQPEHNPGDLVAEYPAHIHMNLLPRIRGQRVGSRLLEHWIADAKAAGVAGIHLGASSGNTGGVAFWTKSGFTPLRTVDRTVWFGMRL